MVNYLKFIMIFISVLWTNQAFAWPSSSNSMQSDQSLSNPTLRKNAEKGSQPTHRHPAAHVQHSQSLKNLAIPPEDPYGFSSSSSSKNSYFQAPDSIVTGRDLSPTYKCNPFYVPASVVILRF